MKTDIKQTPELKTTQINNFNEWMAEQIAACLYNGIQLGNKQEQIITVHNWVALYDIMLNEKSQYQKVIYCMIPSLEHS